MKGIIYKLETKMFSIGIEQLNLGIPDGEAFIFHSKNDKSQNVHVSKLVEKIFQIQGIKSLIVTNDKISIVLEDSFMESEIRPQLLIVISNHMNNIDNDPEYKFVEDIFSILEKYINVSGNEYYIEYSKHKDETIYLDKLDMSSNGCSSCTSQCSSSCNSENIPTNISTIDEDNENIRSMIEDTFRFVMNNNSIKIILS